MLHAMDPGAAAADFISLPTVGNFSIPSQGIATSHEKSGLQQSGNRSFRGRKSHEQYREEKEGRLPTRCRFVQGFRRHTLLVCGGLPVAAAAAEHVKPVHFRGAQHQN
jgi:hypothetical protein